MFRDISPAFALAEAIVLFLAVGLHEFAHCKFADMAGDPTPRYYGRVTLNLTKHFEMSGVIMMVVSTMSGFGLGWGKPAPINPAKMRHPRLDTFIAVADDPFYGNPDFPVRLCELGVYSNLGMALFNLIPFGPLDGHWLVGELLPEKPRYYWYKVNRQIGFVGLIVAVLVMQTLNIPLLVGPIVTLFRLLTGLHA